jgi:hypothetical protein
MPAPRPSPGLVRVLRQRIGHRATDPFDELHLRALVLCCTAQNHCPLRGVPVGNRAEIPLQRPPWTLALATHVGGGGEEFAKRFRRRCVAW